MTDEQKIKVRYQGNRDSSSGIESIALNRDPQTGVPQETCEIGGDCELTQEEFNSLNERLILVPVELADELDAAKNAENEEAQAEPEPTPPKPPLPTPSSGASKPGDNK